MVEQIFIQQTKHLIDTLKTTCANYGLGNDGNEFKIITQAFLYKFLNDKFTHQAKAVDPKLAQANNWEETVQNYTPEEYEMLLLKMGASIKLKPQHYLSYLFNRQGEDDFHKLFDDTLRDIADLNSSIFSVQTGGGAKIQLFDEISQFVHDPSQRDAFCRAIINPLVNINFENIYQQKYDFFSTIFEYMIKDYNKDGGGKYAEYYTPHAVAKVMAEVMIDREFRNVTVYDPSAGSGTLLMNIAHTIGEDKCSIYSQDISQKSSNLLRLNLILNDLNHSIANIIQGDTMMRPAHRYKKFDFIVSNPPFKLDFSEYRDDLDSKINHDRFFAGIPKTPKKDVDKMAIYLLFIQHIMYSLSDTGRAAIVVPTGFITAQSGIEKKIRQTMIEQKMLKGVVSMPSNIFATTGTNVSILFLDKANTTGKVVLMDSSKLGQTIKDGKNQKTILSADDEQQIIDSFRTQTAIEDFSVVVSFDEIAEKNYSFSAGQYFDIKIEYTDITPAEFSQKMQNYKTNLANYFQESKELENQIFSQLDNLKYEKEE
jgi:type I restriction enzyme M protein